MRKVDWGNGWYSWSDEPEPKPPTTTELDNESLKAKLQALLDQAIEVDSQVCVRRATAEDVIAALEDCKRYKAALEAIASQVHGDAGNFAKAALEGYG